MLREKIKNYKLNKKKKKYAKLLNQMKKDVAEIKKLEEELKMGQLELDGGDLKLKREEVPNQVPESPQEMRQQPVQPVQQPTIDVQPMQPSQQPEVEENLFIRLYLINGGDLDVPVEKQHVKQYIENIKLFIVGQGEPFLNIDGKILNRSSIMMFEILVSE